jgi:hypothetical protein
MNRSHYLADTVGAVAGLAFAVLLLFGFASVDPLREATDQELVDWWTDSGNLDATAFSFFFILASVPFFLVFLASLRGRLASAEGGAAPLSAFVFATGLCFAIALLIGDSARGVVAYSVKFGEEPLPGPDTLRYLTSLSTAMVGLVAMPAAALAIAAASWLIARTRALPIWLAAAGAIATAGTAVAVALGAGAFASPLIQLWVVAAGFELWRTRDSARSSQRQPSPSPASSAVA